MPRDCLYWDGHSYQLRCPDDLCHNGDETLCGLWHGHDYDVAEDDEPMYLPEEDEAWA